MERKNKTQQTVMPNLFQDDNILKTTHGFTLIELLVVVLIIGILAAVALPQYQKSVYKSQYAKLKVLAESIIQAQKVFYLENSSFTDNFETLAINMPGQKKETSTTKQYIYSWGECHFDKTTYTIQISCGNSVIGMGYQHRIALPGTSGTEERICYVKTKDLTDFRQSICKNETGQASGTILNIYGTTRWSYQ